MRLIWNNQVPAANLREQWNALVFQMEKPEVFYTWEWATAVARVYGEIQEPWIATAYEGDELVGVAALARASTSAKEAAFLACTTADYCDFISLPQKRQEFVAHVFHDLKQAGTQRVVLANLPADSTTVAELKVSKSFRSFFRTGYMCAQVRLGSPEERRLLTDSLLKKKMFRRSVNTLSRIGPVMLQHDLGAGLPRGVIEKFCLTHVARFLGTGRVSNLVHPERRKFLSVLAALLAERKWFDLMTLRAGNLVVALNYGFRFHGSRFWYQPTVVNKFEDMSPGYCLLTKIIEEASHDAEVQLVDLGLGAEGYKERFENAQRRTLHVTMASSRAALWKVKTRYHAAEAIKRRPRLEAFVRRLQAAAHGARKRIAENSLTNTFVWAGRRLLLSIGSTDEVLLFQWRREIQEYDQRNQVIPVSWETLSMAAMCYSEDRETLDYLLRSAARFRSDKSRGYALLAADGVPQHFAWVAPYEGFTMAELGQKLQAPTPNSVMIFDCWTPPELRGRGLYRCMIGRLATMLSSQDKDAWIFSAAANPASIAGIEKAGFQLAFSLIKRKMLWWAKTRQEARAHSERTPHVTFSSEVTR